MTAPRHALRRAAVGAFLSLAGFAALGSAFLARASHAAEPVPAASFHQLTANSLGGEAVAFQQYAGKVVLAVNVASQCGFTPQYAGLEKLFEELAPKGLVVLGFPSNEFGGQEPGSATEIQTFCKKNYGVSFPMFQKLVTKPGPEQSPVYRFLTAGRDAPSWNFCKYLVGKDGKVISFFPSKVKPEDPELRNAIDAALAG
ncbi:MAG: glutathione peroxidase [bacterium]